MNEHRHHDEGDMLTCGECGSVWCGLCTPTPADRCPFEAGHDDKRECDRCGDDVYTLSSDGLCDGCVHEDTMGIESPEWLVTHTVAQTVRADSAEDAERIARKALESSADLWWVNVAEGGNVERFN